MMIPTTEHADIAKRVARSLLRSAKGDLCDELRLYNFGWCRQVWSEAELAERVAQLLAEAESEVRR